MSPASRAQTLWEPRHAWLQQLLQAPVQAPEERHLAAGAPSNPLVRPVPCRSAFPSLERALWQGAAELAHLGRTIVP
jgi:hypothetical protein